MMRTAVLLFTGPTVGPEMNNRRPPVPERVVHHGQEILKSKQFQTISKSDLINLSLRTVNKITNSVKKAQKLRIQVLNPEYTMRKYQNIVS